MTILFEIEKPSGVPVKMGHSQNQSKKQEVTQMVKTWNKTNTDTLPVKGPVLLSISSVRGAQPSRR
jgi:hypothetical protein